MVLVLALVPVPLLLITVLVSEVASGFAQQPPTTCQVDKEACVQPQLDDDVKLLQFKRRGKVQALSNRSREVEAADVGTRQGAQSRRPAIDVIAPGQDLNIDQDSTQELLDMLALARCLQDTGGTCRVLPCFSWRGEVDCSPFRKCLCKPGFCSVDGVCVKQQKGRTDADNLIAILSAVLRPGKENGNVIVQWAENVTVQVDLRDLKVNVRAGRGFDTFAGAIPTPAPSVDVASVLDLVRAAVNGGPVMDIEHEGIDIGATLADSTRSIFSLRDVNIDANLWATMTPILLKRLGINSGASLLTTLSNMSQQHIAHKDYEPDVGTDMPDLDIDLIVRALNELVAAKAAKKDLVGKVIEAVLEIILTRLIETGFLDIGNIRVRNINNIDVVVFLEELKINLQAGFTGILSGALAIPISQEIRVSLNSTRVYQFASVEESRIVGETVAETFARAGNVNINVRDDVMVKVKLRTLNVNVQVGSGLKALAPENLPISLAQDPLFEVGNVRVATTDDIDVDVHMRDMNFNIQVGRGNEAQPPESLVQRDAAESRSSRRSDRPTIQGGDVIVDSTDIVPVTVKMNDLCLNVQLGWGNKGLTPAPGGYSGPASSALLQQDARSAAGTEHMHRHRWGGATDGSTNLTDALEVLKVGNVNVSTHDTVRVNVDMRNMLINSQLGSSNDAQTQYTCSTNPGGTCRFLGCRASRGETNCVDSKCLCKTGFCVVNGACVAKEQLSLSEVRPDQTTGRHSQPVLEGGDVGVTVSHVIDPVSVRLRDLKLNIQLGMSLNGFETQHAGYQGPSSL